MKTIFRIILIATVLVSLYSCKNIGDKTGYFTDTLTIVNESSHQIDMSEIHFYKHESDPTAGYWYASGVSFSPSGAEDGSDTWSYVTGGRMVIQEHAFARLIPYYVTVTIDGRYTADLTRDNSNLHINPCVADNWSQVETEEKNYNYYGDYTLTFTEAAVQKAMDSFSEITDSSGEEE